MSSSLFLEFFQVKATKNVNASPCLPHFISKPSMEVADGAPCFIPYLCPPICPFPPQSPIFHPTTKHGLNQPCSMLRTRPLSTHIHPTSPPLPSISATPSTLISFKHGNGWDEPCSMLPSPSLPTPPSSISTPRSTRRRRIAFTPYRTPPHTPGPRRYTHTPYRNPPPRLPSTPILAPHRAPLRLPSAPGPHRARSTHRIAHLRLPSPPVHTAPRTVSHLSVFHYTGPHTASIHTPGPHWSTHHSATLHRHSWSTPVHRIAPLRIPSTPRHRIAPLRLPSSPGSHRSSPAPLFHTILRPVFHPCQPKPVPHHPLPVLAPPPLGRLNKNSNMQRRCFWEKRGNQEVARNVRHKDHKAAPPCNSQSANKRIGKKTHAPGQKRSAATSSIQAHQKHRQANKRVKSRRTLLAQKCCTTPMRRL